MSTDQIIISPGVATSPLPNHRSRSPFLHLFPFQISFLKQSGPDWYAVLCISHCYTFIWWQ